MSNTIDRKVVEMEFDNQRFERNVSTSLASIDKLKKSLNFDGIRNSFETINKKADSIDISNIGKSAESVGVKFSALQGIALGVFSKIGASALELSHKLASTLTKGVRDGYKEYELKMGSVQTIQASTGESFATINRYLNELNKYSDDTIYSFSDMTNNIGKFTNNGVKLKDAVLAIKGISNEAALAGANSSQASHAMYNFAQALSAGYVKLIDWKSIENATMATTGFKNELLKTAVACGTVKKDSNGMYKVLSTNAKGSKMTDTINATKYFNESLNYQWMTTEVLVKTLKKYTDTSTDLGKRATAAARDVKTVTMLIDTLKEAIGSGWANTWELIIGDFGEAKNELTKISEILGNIISTISDSRNLILSTGLSTGWKQFLNQGIPSEDELIGYIKKTMGKDGSKLDKLLEDNYSTDEAIKKAIENKVITSKNLQEAVTKYSNYLSKLSKDQLMEKGYTDEEVKSLKKFSTELTNGTVSIDKFTKKIESKSGRENIFQSIYNVIDMLKNTFGTVRKAYMTYFPNTVEDLGEGLYKITESIESVTSKFKNLSEKVFPKVERIFKGVFAVLDIGKTIITGIANGFKQLLVSLNVIKNVDSVFSGLLNVILGLPAGIGDFLVKIRDFITKTGIIKNVLGIIFNTINKVIVSVKQLFTFVDSKFGITDKIERLKRLLKNISEIIATELSKPKKIMNDVFKTIDDMGTKINNAISNFGFDTVKKVLVEIFTILSPQYRKIKVFLTKGLSFKQIVDVITDIYNKLKTLVKYIKDKISLSSKFENIKKSVQETANVINTNFSGTTALFTSIAKAAKRFMEALKIKLDKTGINDFSDIIEKAQNKLSGFVLFIKNVSSTVSKALGRLLKLDTIREIIGLINLGLFAKILNVIKNILENTNAFFDSFGKIATGIKNITDTLTDMSKTLQKNVKVKIIKDIAIAVGILAVSLWLLASIPADKIWAPLVAVSALLLQVTLITKNLIKMKSLKDLKNNSIQELIIFLTGIAISVYILASAVSKLAAYDWKQLLFSTVAVSALLWQMIAMLKVIEKTPASTTAEAIADVMELMGIVFAVKILATALKSLSKLDSDSLKRGIIGITVIMLEMTALLAAIIAINKNNKSSNIIQAGATILALSIAINILVRAVAKIAMLDANSMEQGLSGVTALIVSVGGCMAALVAINKNNSGSSLLGVAASFVALSFAIRTLSKVVEALGSMPYETAKQGLNAVVILLISLSGALVIASTAAKKIPKLSLGMLALSVSLIIISKAIENIGNMNPSVLAQGMIAMAMITGAIVGLAALVGFVPEIGAGLLILGQSMLMCGAGMILFASSFAVLAAFAVAGATALIAAFGIITVGLQSLFPAILEASVKIGVILGQIIANAFLSSVDTIAKTVVVLILQVLELLVQYAPSIVGKLLELIVLVLGAITEKIPSLVSAFVNLIMAILTSFVDALKSIDPSVLAEGLMAIGIMYAIEVAMAGLALIAPLAIVGVLAFGAVILELMNVIAAVGLLGQLPGLQWLLGEGADVLSLVGTAIGRFIGGMINGISTELTGKLTAIAAELSSFMTTIQPFFSGMQNVGPAFDGIKKLTEAIILLTAADIVDGLTRWFTGGKSSIEQFGVELEKFGPHFMNYYNSIQGINPEVIQASANAVKMIAEMASGLPNQGGKIAEWFGDNSLTLIAEGLKAFGPALVTYSNTVSKLDTGAIDISVTAAKKISEMAANLPPQGGSVKTWFEGDSSLVKIAEGLKPFGKALVEYGDTVSKLDASAINVSVNAAKIISEMAAGLPPQGGVFSWFEGDSSLAKIAEGLKPFGEALVEYVKNISGIDIGVIDTSVSLIDSIASLMSKKSSIPAGSLSIMGTELKSFGSSLSGFNTNVQDVNISTINTACEAIKAVFNSLKNVPKIDRGVLSNLGAELPKFGTGVSQYVASIGSIDVSTLNSFGDQFSKAAKSGINEFVNTFSKSNSKVSGSASKVIDTFVKSINAGKSKVNNSMKNIGSNALNALSRYMHDHHDTIYGYGNYAVEGFAEGIDENTFKAEAKAKAMADAALKAAKKALDEKSPSKEFHKVGAFAGMGFVNALSEYGRIAYNVSYGMADKANEGLTKAMKKISDLVDGNLDLQPVISPVIDLDNARAGMRTLNGILDTPTLALTTRIGMINADMNNNQNDLSNKDVVRAIDGLRNDLRNRPQVVNNVNGVTYDGTSDVATAVEDLANAIKIGRRV